MSLFGNQNFMNQIIKDAGLPKIDEEVGQMLQVLVEIETRKLIQHSAKFMRNDSRDQIQFEDVENALIDLNHSEICLVQQEEKYMRDGSTFIRRDPMFKNAKEFIEEETKQIPLNLFSAPTLKGRWIYIEGKIPKTNENISLKSKSDILSIREKALKEKGKKFNIISDTPQSLFTSMEQDYFREVTTLLSNLALPNINKLEQIDLQGNITNMLPMLLSYLHSTELTEAKMVYFLKLLENRYVKKSTEYYLHQILAYLWAYEGKSCFKIGLKIGEVIEEYRGKYPILCRLENKNWQQIRMLDANEKDTLYATLIKRVGIEISTGISVNLTTKIMQMCEEDVKEEHNLAIQLKQVISEYSGEISSLQQLSMIFSFPSYLQDPYLNMLI